jgi:hypothetical protein
VFEKAGIEGAPSRAFEYRWLITMCLLTNKGHGDLVLQEALALQISKKKVAPLAS